jgi:hypothetical protein
VKADRPFELVDAAIRQYAQNKGVHISYIAPLIFHVVTLINIINITIITQTILRFIIRNRCIVVAFNNYFGEHNLQKRSRFMYSDLMKNICMLW